MSLPIEAKLVCFRHSAVLSLNVTVTLPRPSPEGEGEGPLLMYKMSLVRKSFETYISGQPSLLTSLMAAPRLYPSTKIPASLETSVNVTSPLPPFDEEGEGPLLRY